MTVDSTPPQKPLWPEEWSWGVFTIGDVIKILGITRRKILLYVEKGVVKPSIPAEGRGVAARFSVADLVSFGVIQHLDRFGIAIRHLVPFVEKLNIPLSHIEFIPRGTHRHTTKASEIALMDTALSGDSDDLREKIAAIFNQEGPIRMFVLHQKEDGDVVIDLKHWVSLEGIEEEGVRGVMHHDRGGELVDAAETIPSEPVVIVVNLALITLNVLKRTRMLGQGES